MHRPPLDDENDEIFKAIWEEDQLLQKMQADVSMGVPTATEATNPQRQFVRADLATTIPGQAALWRTTTLLAKAGQSYEEWQDKETPGLKYLIYGERFILRDIHRIQKSLISNCTTRDLEQAKLHHLVRGHKESKRFVYNLNHRFKAIAKDIAEYNEAIKQLPVQFRPRELVTKTVRDKGLTLDLFWDINRCKINEEWATNASIRPAMDSILRLKRSQEEITLITLEVERVISWLEAELTGYDSTLAWMSPWIRKRLQHLQRIVVGFSREGRACAGNKCKAPCQY